MEPIRPLSPPSLNISVITPVAQALDRVKLVLFSPFDLGKWVVLGVCAWLAQLGEGGGGFNFNVPGGGNHRGRRGGFERELQSAWDFIGQNLWWIVPLVLGLVLLGVVMWILVTWLNSRGKFMFLHCLARNRAEVVVPWRQYARPANSLFWFRIFFGLLGALVMLPLLAGVVVLAVVTFAKGSVQPLGVAGLAGAFLVFLALALMFGVVTKLTVDFVVPIMALRGCGWFDGWGVLRGLLTAHPGAFLLYLLFQIVLALVTGMLVLIVALVTCCACCLLLLPFVSTVILLPVSVFKRAYSLHYLAQFGREFDVFAPAPGAAA